MKIRTTGYPAQSSSMTQGRPMTPDEQIKSDARVVAEGAVAHQIDQAFERVHEDTYDVDIFFVYPNSYYHRMSKEEIKNALAARNRVLPDRCNPDNVEIVFFEDFYKLAIKYPELFI